MENCEECGGSGWVYVEARNGVVKCDCRKAAEERESKLEAGGTPLTEEAAFVAVDGLCDLLDWAPQKPSSRALLASLVMRMCSTVEQLDWVIREAARLYTRWPGIPGLRQILCSRFRPKDGIETSWSESYPDGLPSGPQPVQTQLVLPPGRIASIDQDADDAVQRLVEYHSRELAKLSPAEEMARRKFDEVLKEAITAPEDRQPPAPPPPGLIAQERAVLEDPATTPERKEIARVILQNIGVPEKEAS